MCLVQPSFLRTSLKMMAGRREKGRPVVTRDTADNFQESDNLYFDNQTVKKLPCDQARERWRSSNVISDCTRRVHARGRQGHPYYSSMKSHCTQVRRKRQRTRDPRSRYPALDRAFPNAVTRWPLTPFSTLLGSALKIRFSRGKKERKMRLRNIQSPGAHNLRDI